jgi:hypothetical protein
MPLLPHRLERLHSGRIEIGHVDDLVIGASETCSTRSYGLQLVYYVMAAGLELREVPIAFADRTKGKSKIAEAPDIPWHSGSRETGREKIWPVGSVFGA